MNLTNLSIADLKSLSEQVEQVIRDQQHYEVRKAREQIAAIAESVGVPLDQLLDPKQPKPKKLVGVKFRHPDDSSKT